MRAVLQESLEDGKVRCNVCAFRCELSAGQMGRCRVRRNDDGEIAYLAYDQMTQVCPFVGHCGAGSYCVGKPSCNWSCSFCLSSRDTIPEFQESWGGDFPVTEDGFMDKKALIGAKLPLFPLESFPTKSPEQVVDEWQASGLEWFAIRLTEPSIHAEATSEMARLVKARGGKVLFGTNGYWTPELVDLLAPLVDVVEIGVKGSANARFLRKVSGVPDPAPIFATLKGLADKGVVVMVSDLPLYHATWEDDFSRLCSLVSEHVPARDFPRLSIAPFGGRIAAEGFGNYKLGIPVAVSDDVFVDSRATLLKRAAYIALDHLDSVWIDGLGGLMAQEIEPLWLTLPAPKVREGRAFRIARSESDLGTVGEWEDANEDASAELIERVASWEAGTG